MERTLLAIIGALTLVGGVFDEAVDPWPAIVAGAILLVAAAAWRPDRVVVQEKKDPAPTWYWWTRPDGTVTGRPLETRPVADHRGTNPPPVEKAERPTPSPVAPNRKGDPT